MARTTKHGKSWIQRHLNDPYVKEAQAKGYRSRASFKILELQEKDKLFKPGMFVVDLGCAPGGWSQVLVKMVGPNHVIALDRLPMPPIPGVIFLEGDFQEEKVLIQLEELVGNKKIDWVLSDMSPNITGVISVDQPRILELAQLAAEFALAHLKEGGGLLVKSFQGSGFDEFYKNLRQHFKQVNIRKPLASRADSRELYVLARGYYNVIE